jgi:uroporphyrinogen decarboxylase
MTSRDLVRDTLAFRNRSGRIPRQMWGIKWAGVHHRDALGQIERDFPPDIVTAPVRLAKEPQVTGSSHVQGTYVDEWGCRFQNIQDGIIGEVKEALVNDDAWDDSDRVHIPEELLSFDRDWVNEFCRKTDKFVLANENPQPFERLQFIRKTDRLYMDLVDPPAGMLGFMEKMHDFYCRWVTKWSETEVDAIVLADDWGSQNNLLISPKIWVDRFKPLYCDYIAIARKHRKKVFMHSDGYILDLYPHLIDMGVDALNSQIFCMGLDKLAQYRGSITFWGEIDRQHLLPYGSAEAVDRAVSQVCHTLWQDGGCIAQCEFGPGAKPENVRQVFQSWNQFAAGTRPA